MNGSNISLNFDLPPIYGIYILSNVNRYIARFLRASGSTEVVAMVMYVISGCNAALTPAHGCVCKLVCAQEPGGLI